MEDQKFYEFQVGSNGEVGYVANQTKEVHSSKIRKRTEIMLLSDNTPIEEIVNTSDSQSDGDYSPPLKIEKKGN